MYRYGPLNHANEPVDCRRLLARIFVDHAMAAVRPALLSAPGLPPAQASTAIRNHASYLTLGRIESIMRTTNTYLLDKSLDFTSEGAENLHNSPACVYGLPPERDFELRISLFHEPWWLSAASGGHFEEAVVKQGDNVVGRLPYVMQRRGPFYCVRMPPFTHMLGPAIEAGDGKPQTRLQRRISITRSLIDQLPRHSYFHQHLNPSVDDGLAIADGLAFQECKFEVTHQYNFEVDCRRSLTELSTGLHLKTRQHIRRAEKEYSVRSVDDPKSFIDFYLKNVHARGRRNRIEFEHFSALFAESRAHESGVILGAFDHADAPVAMTYLVWGHGMMYYLLSTRSFDTADSGAVSLLIWRAMKQAHEMGLVLDLDGVYSSGSARFLSNFGGHMKTRFLIRRSRILYGALQYIKRQVAPDESQFFT